MQPVQAAPVEYVDAATSPIKFDGHDSFAGAAAQALDGGQDDTYSQNSYDEADLDESAACPVNWSTVEEKNSKGVSRHKGSTSRFKRKPN